jgi:hypothetical protein
LFLEEMLTLRTIVFYNGSKKVLTSIDEALEVETIHKKEWDG